MVQVPGSTIRQIVKNFEKQFPGARARLCDEQEDDFLPGLGGG